jgi:formylglycine-generating enzyme required for sulfatase activity
VAEVTHSEALEFAAELNRLSRCGGYRLPTEVEFEYAARAGSRAAYSFGDSPEDLGRYAWHKGNSRGAEPAAGQKLPNAFGLFDMHGLVASWVEGPSHPGPVMDYSGSPSPADDYYDALHFYRIVRGGSFMCEAAECQSAWRHCFEEDERALWIGFRLAADPSPELLLSAGAEPNYLPAKGEEAPESGSGEGARAPGAGLLAARKTGGLFSRLMAGLRRR